MSLFDKLKIERDNYLSQQESLKNRYYNDSKKVFQASIDDLMDSYEGILLDKVKSGRVGQYEFFNILEITHPAEGVYSKEYIGYEALDLFQLLVITEKDDKSYFLSKEVILDDALLEFWELLSNENLKPYFLVTHTEESNERNIYLGVILPE